MTLELTITLILALCLSVGRAHGQAGMLLDPTVGPQPATGFRVAVATAPITADFSFSPTSGAWPLTVQFVDLTQGGPSGWAWNFGDGSATNTSQNPIHTYNSASNFTAILVATGPGGSSSASHTVAVTNSPTWAVGFGGTLSDSGSSVAVNGSGEIYIVGSFQGTSFFGSNSIVSTGGQGLCLAKYDKYRTLQWVQGYSGIGNISARFCGLDSISNLFVAGNFTGTVNFGGTNCTCVGQSSAFVAKYSPTGTHLWSQAFGATNTLAAATFNGLVVDSSGNVAVGGYFNYTVNFGGTNLSTVGYAHVVLAKYSTTGAHLWSETFTANNNDYCYGVGIDKSDNILLTGGNYGSINFGGGNLVGPSQSVEDLFVAKFSSTGAYTWAVVHGWTNGLRGGTVTADTNGNAVVSGIFYRSTDLGGGTIVGTGFNNDMFLAKYSAADGSFVWADPLLCSADGTPNAVECDRQNNIVLAGYYSGTVNFGGQSKTSSGSNDGFASKYDASGTLIWANSFGGSSSDGATGESIDTSGFAVITGVFGGTANFNGMVLTSSGNSDGFTMRLSP